MKRNKTKPYSAINVSRHTNSTETDKNYSEITPMLINTFTRRFYPKRLTEHSGYTCFLQYVCSLGIEPTTFALLTQCSTTEPQEHKLNKISNVYFTITCNIMNCLPQKAPLKPRMMTSSPRGADYQKHAKCCLKWKNIYKKKRIKIVTDLDKQMARCEVTFGLLGF